MESDLYAVSKSYCTKLYRFVQLRYNKLFLLQAHRRKMLELEWAYYKNIILRFHKR